MRALCLCALFACQRTAVDNVPISDQTTPLIDSTLDQQLDDALAASDPADPTRFIDDQIEAAYAREDDGTIERSGLVDIIADDGVRLAAQVFQPKVRPLAARYPTVVFANSWTLDRFEYLVPAAKLAKRGYIVLSYTTRGFGFSGGQIDTAGPKDRADLRVVLDWLEANTQVDRERIGMAGVSYGAGIALIGLSTEPRIKVAASMSGWGSLRRSLYGNDTPRMAWGLILIGSGYFTGRMDPIIAKNFRKMLRHEDIERVTAWADQRSPISYVEQLNAAGKPVYISNNMQDYLFNTNGVLDYFARLTVPRRLDLNEGVHASAEGAGLLGVDNRIWSNVYAWLDHYLQGTPLPDAAMVTIEQRFRGGHVTLSNWPAPELTTRNFTLNEDRTLVAGVDTVATTGLPILSDVAAVYTPLKVTAHLGWVNRLNAAVSYIDGPFDLVGPITWRARVKASRGDGNVNLYLYDVAEDGTATLITHGTGSVHDQDGWTDVSFDLMAIAHRVEHRLALVVDTVDLLYAQPTLLPYRLGIEDASLTLTVAR